MYYIRANYFKTPALEFFLWILCFRGAYRYRFGPNKGISPLSVTQRYHRRIKIAHSQHLKNGPIWVRGVYGLSLVSLISQLQLQWGAETRAVNEASR